jgi:hypothetical protein
VRLIIAGGREHRDPTLVQRAWIASPFSKNGPVGEIVTGGARGVDTLAFDWSHKNGLGWPRVFQADWKTNGRSAGPIRNEAMARYAAAEPDGALLAIPGKGRGTRDMIERARRYGLRVFVYEAPSADSPSMLWEREQ